MKIKDEARTPGPFALVVQPPYRKGSEPRDQFVVMPSGGFKTKEEALDIAKQYEEPDEDLVDGDVITVVSICDPGSLKRFMSW